MASHRSLPGPDSASSNVQLHQQQQDGMGVADEASAQADTSDGSGVEAIHACHLAETRIGLGPRADLRDGCISGKAVGTVLEGQVGGS